MKKNIIIIAILVIGIFGYNYWINTPQYSLLQIQKSVDTKDRFLFDKYVDTNGIIEEVVEAYNNKDVEGFLKHFADEWQATDLEGNTETRNKADARERMQEWFDETETIEWKPWLVAPLKIYDTDPLAG